MSTDRDVTRIVRSWLHEDAYEDADRILNLVLVEIDTTPQRSASWLARRFPTMNSPIRIGIAAAVVVVAAILGFTYLNSEVGTDTPTPTPSLTANPTATPVAVPQLPPLGAGMEPGRYSLHVPDSTIDAVLTVGDGWTAYGWYIAASPQIFTKQVSFWTVENVYQDLCDPGSLPDPAIGPTVDDLVAALDAQANTDMSPPVEMEIGGFPATVVTMAQADMQTLPEACFEFFGATESVPYFVIAGDQSGRELPFPESLDTLWIIDVDGQRVVIATSQVDPEDTDATTTIAGVIDSIEFEVP
jgi:hypothetical protein